MNKTDLAVFVAAVQLCNQKGLLAIEAFQQIGQTMAKANQALEAMGDNDVLVISKAPPKLSEEDRCEKDCGNPVCQNNGCVRIPGEQLANAIKPNKTSNVK